jgi:hypothetical protein
MKQFWIVSGLVVAALAASTLLVVGHDVSKPVGPDASGPGEGSGARKRAGLPWQVDVLADGSTQAMGLTLSAHPESGSTLQTAYDMWQNGMEIAIIAAPGENGTLEAFVDPLAAGFISGKGIITAQLPADQIKALRERALKAEFMDSTTRKYTLDPADLPAALKAPISALSFIPQANLDEAAIVSRFGQPAERVRSNGHLEHFLYPAKGLDVALDTEGKELLQYVAPAEFNAKLKAPLLAAMPASSVKASQP